MGKKLLVRAPSLVISRKGYGWPKGHRWLGALCFRQNYKKMKKNQSKILLLVVVSLAFIPSLALASWWNPFTWSVWGIFRHNNPPAIVVATTTPSNLGQNKNNPPPSSSTSSTITKPVKTTQKPSGFASGQPENSNQKKIEQSGKNYDKELIQLITRSQQDIGVYNQAVQEVENFIPIVQGKMNQYPNETLIQQSGQALIDENRNLESTSKKLVELESNLRDKFSSYVGSNLTDAIISEVNPIKNLRDDYAARYLTSNSVIKSLMKNLALSEALVLQRLTQETQQRIQDLRNSQIAPPQQPYVPPQQQAPAQDPQIESALSALRNTLSQISDNLVAMSVMKGQLERATQNWIQQNPNVFSYPNYVTQFNSIVASYGLYYLAIPQ